LLRDWVKIDNIIELDYMGQVMYEAFRVNPPVSHPSIEIITEDFSTKKYSFKEGTRFMIDIYGTHRDPREYQ
jgi:cytochrome P450